MTAIIPQAVKGVDVRATISKGSSNLGGGHNDRIFYLGYCPHEWLFQHVAAVVHHGRADTTACGLGNGKPTTVVPFLGESNLALSLKRYAGEALATTDKLVPGIWLNGMTVDTSLDSTEGLRNAPRYYGEEARDHSRVTGWKSGAVVAGKTFAWGMAEGVSDIIVKPYQGVKKEDMLSAVEGFGNGVRSMGAKTDAAMFGVIVYPGAGIAKSLKSSIHFKTRKKIVEGRHKEGRWLAENGVFGAVDSNSVITTFEALQSLKP